MGLLNPFTMYHGHPFRTRDRDMPGSSKSKLRPELYGNFSRDNNDIPSRIVFQSWSYIPSLKITGHPANLRVLDEYSRGVGSQNH